MHEFLKSVDFHVHYNPADENTAYEAIDIASRRNIVAMTVLARSQVSSNYNQFIEYGRRMGIEIVPGIEFISRTKDGKSAGLIFLGFDPNSLQIEEYFGIKYFNKDDKAANTRLAIHQRKFLEKEGFVYEELTKDQEILMNKLMSGELGEKAFNFCWIAASQLDNFKLVENLKIQFSDTWVKVVKKYAHLPNYEADAKRLDAKLMYLVYFDVGKPGYMEVRTEAGVIINVIHKAGGVVLYSPEGQFSENIWNELLASDIDGIMGWHGGKLGANGRNEPDVSRNVVEFCIKNGLLVLGGSDYQQLDWEVGIGNGSLFNSPRRYEELKNYIISRNQGKLPWK